MPSKNPLVDAYIAKAQPFARPILRRIRSAVHKGCPKVEEFIKWGFPHFDYKGTLCSMAAFKGHAVLGFWKAELLSDGEGVLERSDRTAMGHLGRMSRLADLPQTVVLVRLVKQAAALNEAGIKSTRVAAKKPPLRVPAFLLAAIRENTRALATWKSFSPSCRREYVEWVTEAKQPATRARRVAETVALLAQGKKRHWKYASDTR